MSEPQRVVALAEPRHTCFGCGKCCFGHKIGLLDEAEAARIEKHAKTLGVENPVEDGALRFENGRCLFLGDDMLCTIHKEFGMSEKPLRCQAWPLKIIRTEAEIRIGIDPGCVNSHKSWQTGEIQQPHAQMVVRPFEVSPMERQFEMGLIQASLQPGMNIALLAHLMAGVRPEGDVATGLPPGMAKRVITRLKALRFSQFLAHPELGIGIQEPAAHLAKAIEALDPDNPPAWPAGLTEEQEAYALDVFRRKLFLREAPMEPRIHGLAILALAGILLNAWADPSEDAFGSGLAVWTRLVRFEAFWLRFLPEPQMIQWVAEGGPYQGQLSPDIVIGKRDDA